MAKGKTYDSSKDNSLKENFKDISLVGKFNGGKDVVFQQNKGLSYVLTFNPGTNMEFVNPETKERFVLSCVEVPKLKVVKQQPKKKITKR